MEIEKLSKPSVLLVDDEPMALQGLKLQLQALSFDVISFLSGQEAIEYLTRGANVDIFLCDLKMPGMNGLDVLSNTLSINSKIPFILISSYASKSEVNKAFELGAAGFLGKPFNSEEFAKCIETMQLARQVKKETGCLECSLFHSGACEGQIAKKSRQFNIINQ